MKIENDHTGMVVFLLITLYRSVNAVKIQL